MEKKSKSKFTSHHVRSVRQMLLRHAESPGHAPGCSISSSVKRKHIAYRFNKMDLDCHETPRGFTVRSKKQLGFIPPGVVQVASDDVHQQIAVCLFF
jgi:hypothetical protein